MDSNFKKDLYDFINIIIKRKIIIFITIVSFLFLSLVYTFIFSSKTYVYTSKVYLNLNANGYNVDRQVISQLKYEVTSLFMELGNSASVIEKIENKYGLNELGSKFNYEQIPSNPIIKITYLSDKELDSTKDLETYLNALIQEYKNICPDVEIKIVDNFNLSMVKGPKVQRNILISIIGALLVSLIVIIILELFDNKVRKIEEVCEIFKSPNVLFIPKQK